MTEIICDNCKKKCEKPTKEINRQIKQGRIKFYCSLSCSTSNLKTTTEKIKSNCLFCGKEIDTTTHKNHKKCCNKNCATKYAQSFTDKEKIAKTIKKLWDGGIYGERNIPKLYDFVCVTCRKPFQKLTTKWISINDPFKTCGDGCYRKLISKWTRENPNCGGKLGYRRFKYRGFTMDSRWEVDIAKWMDSEGS